MPYESTVRSENEIIVVGCYGADIGVVNHLSESSLTEAILLPIDPYPTLLVQQIENLDVIVVGKGPVWPS